MRFVSVKHSAAKRPAACGRWALLTQPPDELVAACSSHRDAYHDKQLGLEAFVGLVACLAVPFGWCVVAASRSPSEHPHGLVCSNYVKRPAGASRLVCVADKWAGHTQAQTITSELTNFGRPHERWGRVISNVQLPETSVDRGPAPSGRRTKLALVQLFIGPSPCYWWRDKSAPGKGGCSSEWPPPPLVLWTDLTTWGPSSGTGRPQRGRRGAEQRLCRGSRLKIRRAFTRRRLGAPSGLAPKRPATRVTCFQMKQFSVFVFGWCIGCGDWARARAK